MGNVHTEIDVDEQHGRIVRVHVGDIVVGLYLDVAPSAVVTTPDGQYGIELHGDHKKFWETTVAAVQALQENDDG